MATDRTLRTLSALGTASSSRVLNLTAISLLQAGNEGHRNAPFFISPVINSALVIKHRLRANEVSLLPKHGALATKVLVPFEKANLNVGGRSFLVGERSYEDMLLEIGTYKTRDAMKRDLDVLHLLDTMPSLDPFLLREQMSREGFNPDPGYFAITASEQQRMYDFSVAEVSRLTSLAMGRNDRRKNGSAGKMTTALLANQIGEVLDPLRLTLNLNPAEFSEGIFSWRGFLYYKWSLETLWPELLDALREIRAIRPKGPSDGESQWRMGELKQALVDGVRNAHNEVRRILAIYDDAYASLIDKQDPKMFRDFLLSAPELFVDAGEKIGAMSHVASFWRYRFPGDSPKTAGAEELFDLFTDFAQSLGVAP
jgi:hypothetical protein